MNINQSDKMTHNMFDGGKNVGFGLTPFEIIVG